MPREDIQPYQHNLALKRAFGKIGLDPEPVLELSPLDLDLENRRLESLLLFVKKYKNYGNRAAMESIEGPCCWPPVFPGLGPEADWVMFERWMDGKPVREPIMNQFSLHEKFRPAGELNDMEIEAELERLIKHIHETGNGVSLNDIPARLAYAEIMKWAGEDAEVIGGGWFFDGCSGSCPDCFQRPWCDTGLECCWREDDEAGKIVFIDELKNYVSASPQSYHIIRKLQDEKDEEEKIWMEEMKNRPPGDLPF